MMFIAWCVRALIVAATLMAPIATSAESARGRVGFDYYLFSLSVAPAFCSESRRNAATDQCEALTQESFRHTPLTIHGLWPNRAKASVNLQPRDCDGPPFRVSRDVQTKLRRYMPAGIGLERYEWRKHGTCSGLPPERYFAVAAELARQANATIGAAMLDQGDTLRVADLLRTIGARDPALAAGIVVDCRFPRGGGDAVVQEIRITLGKDFGPIPASSVGLGQNSGCPAGAGRIPAVSR